MNGVLIAAAVVGILGIIIGIFLGVSGAKFEVKVDERAVSYTHLTLPTTNEV